MAEQQKQSLNEYAEEVATQMTPGPSSQPEQAAAGPSTTPTPETQSPDTSTDSMDDSEEQPKPSSPLRRRKAKGRATSPAVRAAMTANRKQPWSISERSELYRSRMKKASTPFDAIGKSLGRTPLACRLRLHHDRKKYHDMKEDPEQQERFDKLFHISLHELLKKLGPPPKGEDMQDKVEGKGVNEGKGKGQKEPGSKEASGKETLRKVVPKEDRGNDDDKALSAALLQTFNVNNPDGGPSRSILN